ncbi:MAG: tetratricopeptide repeat protein [Desulfamplus sp.]|nr:tetratricopeptide repeat protein [Desulfamplus sp.]
MKQHLKFFSLAIFILVNVLIGLSLSSCGGYLIQNTPQQPEIKQQDANTPSEDSAKIDGEIVNNKIKEENQLNADDEMDTEDQDFSQSAYYYYIKSERHKQKGETALAIDALKQAIDNDPESIYLKKSMIFLHLINKDNASAINVAKELVQKHPDDEDILLILAKLNLQLNNLNEAKTIYERIIELNPQNHDAYIVLGNLYMENNGSEDAFRLFSKMVGHFPESYAAHYFLGKINVQKKNFIQAEKALLRSIELKKDLVEPRFELITIYKSNYRSQKDSDKKVIALYEDILKIDKNNIKAAIELPLFLYKKGEKSKASKMFVGFGQRYQNSETMMMAMAKEIINNQRSDDAIIIFTEILKGDPQNSALHYIAGVTFDSLKESKKAISHFMKVTPDSEQYKKSIFHTAYIYSQMKQPEKSIELLESKLNELSGDTELIVYLAAFYEEANQLDKAFALLQQGLVVSPDDTELLFRSGIIADKSGDKDGCIKAMKRVIELDPDHSSALNYLGYTYAEIGTNLDEAEELVSRSLELKPNDGYITDSLGWIYYKKGMYDKAIEILEKAVNLSSEDPVITEHLGDAYKGNKMYHKAIEAYKKALSKNQNPENKAVLEKKIDEITNMIKKQN